MSEIALAGLLKYILFSFKWKNATAKEIHYKFVKTFSAHCIKKGNSGNSRH